MVDNEIRHKSAERQRIADDVAAFLERGGKIEKLPDLSDDQPVRSTHYTFTIGPRETGTGRYRE